jgi:hypothetical protein
LWRHHPEFLSSTITQDESLDFQLNSKTKYQRMEWKTK